MPTTDGFVYRSGSPSTLVSTVDAILDFESTRESRSIIRAIPAGGTARVIRPHGPRTGTFRFLFTGSNAQSRATALEASLGTGASHFLSGTTGLPPAWVWTVTGNLSVQRVHEAGGKGWIVVADWTETP